jgi:exopolysaccharide production protein ExoQ
MATTDFRTLARVAANRSEFPRPVEGRADVSLTQQLFATLYLLGTMGLFGSLATIAGLDRAGALMFAPLYLWLLMNILSAAYRGGRLSAQHFLCFTWLIFGLILSAVFCYKPLGAIFNVILLFFDILFAFWLFQVFDRDAFLRILVLSVGVMLLLSIPAGLVDPEYIIYRDPLDRANVLGFQNIKGLFPHKIHAGIFYGIAFAASLALYRLEVRRLYLVVAGLFFLGMAASGSSVALVATVSGGGLAWGLMATVRRLGWFFVSYLMGWLVIMVVAIAVSGIYPDVMRALGRDPSMTGRVPIWQYAIQSIINNPLIGLGYGVYFDPDLNSPAQGLWRSLLWYTPPSFHSGYLQVLAEVGVVGSIGFFAILIGAVRRCVRANDFFALWIVMVAVVTNAGAALFVTHRCLPLLLLIYFAFRADLGKVKTILQSTQKAALRR